MRKKSMIYYAGLITLFGLGGVGILLIYFFHDRTFAQIFFDYPRNIFSQLFIGLAYGIITSMMLVFLLQKEILKSTRSFFSNLMHRFKVTYADIIFLSFCAGVGEELLFRGAIQPWLGIWLTTIIFIALHGYLNPKDKPMLLYGIVLTLVCGGFGYLMNYAGLWSAAAAHFVIDVVLMLELKRKII